MKTEHILIGVAVLAALYVYSKKSGGGLAGILSAQTNPASRNPNTGIGSAANTPNNWLNQGTQLLNGGASLFNAGKTALAGLGSGSTPGKTVGIATDKASVPSGNESFDNQDYYAQTSGSDMSEYYDQYIGG